MVIVVNTNTFGASDRHEAGTYAYELFSKIARENTGCRFVLLFSTPYNRKFVFGSNVKPLVISPPANNSLLRKFWYSHKIPAIVKKEKADVFVSFDGQCLLRTKLPQCVVVSALSFLSHPAHLKKSLQRYYKKFTPLSLAIAKTIVVPSVFLKNEIIQTYKVADTKIEVVHSAAGEVFYPVKPDDKKLVKEKYTGGREYFFYKGGTETRNNLLNLLKAFSIFKKRQQTGMKLVLAVAGGQEVIPFAKSLETYKYRNDVLLIENPDDEEQPLLTGAAYAIILPLVYEGFGTPLFEAMKCNVPVIAPAGKAIQEIAKNSALYVNADDINDLAEKMMLIYKDENLKNKLVENVQEVAAMYSFDNTAGLLWKSTLKACNK